MILRLCTLSCLARVIIFSALRRTASALARVVRIRSCRNSAATMLEWSALRWLGVRPSGL